MGKVSLDRREIRILLLEGIAPSAVSIGLRVKMRVQPAAGDDDPYPVFVPLDGKTAGASA